MTPAVIRNTVLHRLVARLHLSVGWITALGCPSVRCLDVCKVTYLTPLRRVPSVCGSQVKINGLTEGRAAFRTSLRERRSPNDQELQAVPIAVLPANSSSVRGG